MREWISRLFAVGRRGRRDHELVDELQFHVEQLAAAHERRGLPPAAARLEAERELGGVGRTQQAWRDQRALPPAAEFVQDAAYGWRVLRRSPGLALTAGLMLALAVAATTSVFAVVDAVLLAPLPYARADRLVVITEYYRPMHAPGVSIAPGNFFEWQDRSHAFSALTAIAPRQQNLTTDGEPLQLAIAAVSAGFGSTIGAQPIAGRLFTDDQYQPGHENVAIISHALWTSRYARDPGVIGRPIVLDDHPYTVVGVMPEGFMFPAPVFDAWVPLPMTAADRDNRTGHGLQVVARLRDHVTVSDAAADLHAIADALRIQYPVSNRDWDVDVTPARAAMVGPTTTVVAMVMGAVVLLLCVACANVAGLLLTHGLSRDRELAIRAALGAGRLRIVRQLLTESLLLSVAGGAAGVVLAWAAQPLLAALRPANLLAWKPIAIDARALAFSFAVAVAAGVLFGTLPALIASRANIAAAASERTTSRGSPRTRQALVAVEVALALVLVAGAALLGQSLARLTSRDPGFRPDGVVTMTLSLPQARYADDGRVDAFYRALLDRVRALPGVRAAGAVQALPLSGSTSVRPYRVEGGPEGPARPTAHYRIVTPGYLDAMRIPLRAGRAFTDRDTADRPLVVMVNETLRRQIWGDRNAIGQRITFGGSNDRWAEVVGLVGDVHHFGPATAAPAEMYWPSEQIDALPDQTLRQMRRGLTLVVRAERSGNDDPLNVVPSIRRAVAAIDPDQPVASVLTMASLVDQSLYLSRAAAWLVSVFGAAAAVFALLGVFGAASYAVLQRRRELAVRMALGAGPDVVARLVLRSTLRGAVAGVVAGLVLAVALGSTVRALLVGVEPGDPTTLAVVSVALVLAAAAACWLPARRAARIDPMQALRLD